MKYSITFNTTDKKRTDGYLPLLSDFTGGEDGMIYLGDTDAQITEKAKKLLSDALAGKSSDTVGYAVASEGGSVAAVWSDWHLEEAAILHLADNLGEMSDGYSYAYTAPLMPYLDERGKQIVEKKWIALEEKIGPEYGPAIIGAMKDLYKLFADRKMVEWEANLYEPKIGGWYCSNSARDNDGYLPDIESTYVALSFLASSGMCEMFGGDWTRAVPDWLKQGVIDFFIPLQREDSFFYHPQWPKELIIANDAQARITRDRGTAFGVLKKLGCTPKYSEPQRSKDDGAPRMMTQFESVDNFRVYMKKLEDEALAITDPKERAAKFYFYGNLFQSTTTYLNDNAEMKKIFTDFLERHQNPSTGLWADVVCYHGANGLHKIADTANKIGYKLNYIDQMVDSILEIINYTVDTCPAAGAVYIYNAWSCFPYIYENVLEFGDGTPEERLKRKTAIKNRVLAAAPAALRAAVDQMQGFKRPEGGFSYGRGASGGISQRCPSSVPGIMEAGLGGNSIAVTALKLYIFKALELTESDLPPVFTECERMRYMEILEELRSKAN